MKAEEVFKKSQQITPGTKVRLKISVPHDKKIHVYEGIVMCKKYTENEPKSLILYFYGGVSFTNSGIMPIMSGDQSPFGMCSPDVQLESIEII